MYNNLYVYGVLLILIDFDWVFPKSDLIDSFPERSMYPAVASLVRNKRIANDPFEKNLLPNYSEAQSLQYVDPILAELKIGKRSEHVLKNSCPKDKVVKDSNIFEKDSTIECNSGETPNENKILNTVQLEMKPI